VRERECLRGRVDDSLTLAAPFGLRPKAAPRSWRFGGTVVKWRNPSLGRWTPPRTRVIPSVTDPRESDRPRARFPTTHWSQVVKAGDRSAPGASAALAELCAAYWYPLYAFVRRRGHVPESAEDLVQGFFAALLEKGSLSTLDRTKGRFRSFLVAACSHYLANRHDHDRARKRGSGRVIVPIDAAVAEDRYRREPAHELTAERLFERRWATTLLDHVLGRLEAEMDAAGKASTFVALRPALLGSAERLAYAEIADELGCSEGAARTAVHRLRARYRTLLREEVARTLDDPDAVDEEIRELFATFES
jgi:RNA polymerase sigma factor (sigma-70 family)